MTRIATADIDLQTAASVDLIFQIAVRSDTALRNETLTFTQNGQVRHPTVLTAPDGTRFHRLRSEEGLLQVRYAADIEPSPSAAAVDELELIDYVRPSRYSESDALFAQARRQFRGLGEADLVQAVSDYVHDSLTYTWGSSTGTDSAVTVLAKGQGVCRDFAHAVIALLRAMDVPARYAACYAPGLSPMDFHAVAEAYLDGAWHVVDATHLSNRHGLVRIATGADASDCAWLSYHGGAVSLQYLWVNASSDIELPFDDHSGLVQIA
ncbi:transglutaminase [Microbacterium mangrovi]|uniref:Transglutaminase n=1 Tax=Microbacterium mangrovi TaxID=1348253 RepID=A0A0B2AAV7_9MICO|nr:transglutaminase family protein [Microbacterium mangrovi]KHK98712.1 transglutaminase [Microbacterium mangrovi]